jgi:serine/threonine protein kinase
LLLDRISVGGMAEVFKAKSYGVEGFEKIIAIKRILPTMGEDRDFIKMFIDEAKIAGQLAHANICQIFELGRIDGSHFIAMEYIWGKDLLQIQNRLRKVKQPMPIPMACFTIAKVLEGLDYAHRKRDPLGRPLEIVHRDCSPQNVLVSYEGEVKIIDFGIAKATSRNSRTMAGVLKGKFGYMSPEQVRGLPLDRRSDIFALGTMLYECLTGDRLFQGETDFSTLEKVRNVDIRPPREINPNIPQTVEGVILRALAKDVEERYQWCSEMLADLQAFLMSQDVVFTAKSLSSWLKEVFSTEIDRERQQLEQYKRVGRDGLIDGMPAAEAKMDVVKELGEAGAPEGDPTTLGEPSFDDLEQAAGAAPEVGPAPGSPAARGDPLDDDDGSGDFGEEAPTEIFGEINDGANAAAPPPSVARVASSPRPSTRPPKPPPSRAPTSRGEPGQPVAMAAQAAQPGVPPRPAASFDRLANQPQARAGIPAPPAGFVPAVTPPPSGFAVPSYANPANAGASYQQYSQPAHPRVIDPRGPASEPGHSAHTPLPKIGPAAGQEPEENSPIALGTPGTMPITPPQAANGATLPNPGQGRTLIGAAAPRGLPNYAQGYPYGQSPLQPPSSPHPAPAQAQAQAHAPSYPYGSPDPYMGAVPPVEQAVPVEGRRKSSIARDVAIGVAIAALVLGGFLVVKFFVLDRGGGTTSEPSTPASSFATNRLSVPPASSSGSSSSLAPGGSAAPTAGSGNGSAQPSAGSGNGSGSDSGSAAGSGLATAGVTQGSSEPKSADTPPSDHPVPDTADKMPVEDKGKSADKTPVEDKGKPTVQGGTKPVADKVAIKTTDKPADRPADKVKPVEKVKPTGPEKVKPAGSDKVKPTGPARPPAAEDDLLGKLQGGSKPVNKKPLEIKKPPEKTSDKTTDKMLEKPPEKASDKTTDDPSLKQPPKSPADPKGYAAITSNPSAKIWVDGKDTGLSTPIAAHALPLSPGKHKITFVLGNDKTTYTINVKAGETTPLHKDLQ